MTVQDVIKLLEQDGWRQIGTDDCRRHLKHDTKRGVVTLNGHLELVVPTGVLRNLLRHVQIEEGD